MYVIYVLTVACLSASWQVEAKPCNLISYQLLLEWFSYDL